MESKIYRLEESTGKIYTEWEYSQEYMRSMPDFGILKSSWELLPIVPTEGLDIEEVRSRMRYIYQKPIYREGDILKKDVTSRQSWTVQRINGALMGQPNTNKFFTDIEPIELEGEYIKIANVRELDFFCSGASLVDKMRPSQIAYNLVMSKLGN